MPHEKRNDMPDQKRNPETEEVPTIERRFFKTEARASKADDGRMVIGGYGAVFNEYTNMGWYAEVIMPGFFDGIKDDRCACLFNHEPSQVLGRKKNGTMKLKVDEKGLDYEATLPGHRADVFELVEGGYIYESSFAFTTKKSTWAEVDRSMLADKLSEDDLNELSDRGKIWVRQLEQGRELFDASPVTYGAYEGTSTDTRIARRSFETWKETRNAENTPADNQNDQDNEDHPTPSRRARLLESIERAAQ